MRASPSEVCYWSTIPLLHYWAQRGVGYCATVLLLQQLAECNIIYNTVKVIIKGFRHKVKRKRCIGSL